MISRTSRIAGCGLGLLAGYAHAQTERPLPRLQPDGASLRLLVDDHPFLIRGGELGNSSAANPEYLARFWPRFLDLKLNTLLVPAYWDLLEPQEGRFDFTGLDAEILQARASHLRLVLLWFGTWKNSMSCYAPDWVKRDPARFPRALGRDGRPSEILTAFSPANLQADVKAFTALMRHLRSFDAGDRTVLMIQVENEIGSIPDARDHSPPADLAYASAVPSGVPRPADAPLEGTWATVFGNNAAGEEAFMAWHYARYVQAVAIAGKREYPLPMYVNAALIRPGYQPGQYPSAGPLPHLFALWRAGAPAVDLLSPDIYFHDFAGWARRYSQPRSALFIPEAEPGANVGLNALYAYAGLGAIGFSPFAIDTLSGPAAQSLRGAYDLVLQLEPLILSRGPSRMAGLIWEGVEAKQPQRLRLAGYELNVTFSGGEASGGLVLALGSDEFLVAGTGIVVTFTAVSGREATGILSAEDGHFQSGVWRPLLRLSGDQTNQGRHIRLESGRFSMQRVNLYRY